MTIRKYSLAALAVAVGLAGGSGIILPTLPAAAQTDVAPAAAPDHPGERHGREHRTFKPGRHLDGRIAFFKAELKITDAQEPQFDKVAAVMRQNVAERGQLFEQLRGDRDMPKTAVQRLEMRSRIAQLRAQQGDRFLAAFKPLYGSLSPDQKKAADELLASRHEHHGWRR